jgi:hypothetical protein
MAAIRKEADARYEVRTGGLRPNAAAAEDCLRLCDKSLQALHTEMLMFGGFPGISASF